MNLLYYNNRRRRKLSKYKQFSWTPYNGNAFINFKSDKPNAIIYLRVYRTDLKIMSIPLTEVTTDTEGNFRLDIKYKVLNKGWIQIFGDFNEITVISFGYCSMEKIN